jgi:hypothetical protein
MHFLDLFMFSTAGPRRVIVAMANHLKPWTVTSPWNQAAIWL